MKTRLHTTWVYIVIAFLLGIIVTTQAKMNGTLAENIEDSLLTSMLSLWLAFACSVVVYLFTPKRTPARELVRYYSTGSLRYWILIAGVPGAFLVWTQSTQTPLIGMIAFTVAVVSGQAIGGILVDLSRKSSVQFALSRQRIAGTLVTVAAIFLVNSGGTVVETDSAVFWLGLFLTALAGFLTAFQQSAIGVIRSETNSILNGALLAFLSSTIAIGIIALVSGFPDFSDLGKNDNPILFLAGCLGFLVVYGISIVVGRIGVLVLGLAMTAGQVSGAALWDVALLGLNQVPIPNLIAVVVSFLGVAIASMSKK